MAHLYQPIRCIDCGVEFVPRAGNQKRCNDCAYKCKLAYARKWNKENADRARYMSRIRKAEAREKKRIEKEMEERKAARKPRKKPIMSWKEIIQVCEENHISYGKAVAKGLIK